MIDLHVARDSLALLRRASNAILLGIIEVNGRVVLREADHADCPSHAAWVRVRGMVGIWRGFSLGIRQGKVAALYPASVLNPGRDALLEPALIIQLEAVLPLADAYRVLEY